MNYADFENRLRSWATAQPGLRAIVAVGSRARPSTPDRLADLDLVIFSTRARSWGAGRAWLSELGEVVLAVPGQTGRGDPEWQVLYAGGMKVDFVLAPLVEDLSARPLPELLGISPYGFVFRRGLRLVFDRLASSTDPLPPADFFASGEPGFPPTGEEFNAALDQFWMQVARATLFLRRGDLLPAARVCNCALLDRLVAMLVWQALAASQGEVRSDGRDLPEAATASLQKLVTLPDPDRIQSSIDLGARLFERSARSTAENLGLPYPLDFEDRFLAWLRELD